MAKVYPFRALRPNDGLAPLVASVPYDVVNREEARELGSDSKSFLHVTKPEIDLADSVDPYDAQVYAQGRKALDGLIEEGTLIRDTEEAFFLYRLTMDGRTQTGFVMTADVGEYDQNIVRKHEYTRPDKEDDRVRNIEALAAQSGNVFLAHRDHEELQKVTKATLAEDHLYNFEAVDGIRHEVWKVDARHNQAILGAFEDLGPIYIADGHHRSAAASRVAKLSSAGDDAQRFLVVSFPESELKIWDYNRVVDDLHGHTPAEFLKALKELGELREVDGPQSKRHEVSIYLTGKWFQLSFAERLIDESDPVGRLDVSLLQTHVLEPLLGIDNPRTNKRIQFVGGIRGAEALMTRVDAGAGVAFKMYPPSLDELFTIADAGEVMPPKSTWFEPKLRDGLFVHVLDSLTN